MNTNKALIVSPYLDHLGGGERYMLEAASVIEKLGYEIHFAWNKLADIAKLTKLLNLKLTSPQLDPAILPLYHSRNPLRMWRATRQYDLVLYLSDGSIPFLGGKRNFIHIQVPFHGVGGRSLLTQLKLSTITGFIVNSKFTKIHIDHEFAVNSQVAYPPIQQVKAQQKSKLILSVGRFDPSLNIKRHDILIKAFKSISPQLPGWRLALVGGSSNKNWLNKLKKQAIDLPIDFYPNLPYAKLVKLYAKAKIYWHAAGYQVNEETHPELCEHFGITTAEAITAGCIPLVVPKGGQAEVVPESSYHWHDIADLSQHTLAASRRKLKSPQLPQPLSLSQFQSKINKLISV